jgi:hypothetical protein
MDGIHGRIIPQIVIFFNFFFSHPRGIGSLAELAEFAEKDNGLFSGFAGK